MGGGATAPPKIFLGGCTAHPQCVFCFFWYSRGEHWPSLAGYEPAEIHSSDTSTRNFFVTISKNMYELHVYVFRCSLEFLIIVFGMF